MTRNRRHMLLILLTLTMALLVAGCSGGKVGPAGKSSGRTAKETQQLRDAQVTAYSTRSRTPIPRHAGQHSTRSRTPLHTMPDTVPDDAGHFRLSAWNRVGRA